MEKKILNRVKISLELDLLYCYIDLFIRNIFVFM